MLLLVRLLLVQRRGMMIHLHRRRNGRRWAVVMGRWRLVEVVSGGGDVVLLLGVRMVVLQWIFGVRRAGPVELGTVGPHVMKRGLGVRGRVVEPIAAAAAAVPGE